MVEVKAVEELLPVPEAQLLFYLRVSGLKVGLLASFNVALLKNGLRRMVNRFEDSRRPPRARRSDSSLSAQEALA
jgi:hypothetical protein